MSDPEAHERTYTVFHEDGPITLTEHELLNEYMHLREQLEAMQRDFEIVADDRQRLRSELRGATQIVAALVYRMNKASGVLLFPDDLERDLQLSRYDSTLTKTTHLFAQEAQIGFVRPNPNPENRFQLFHEMLSTEPMPWSGVYPPGTPGLTHGRHCGCTACLAEDWSRPELAPCGMHGLACPDYQEES